MDNQIIVLPEIEALRKEVNKLQGELVMLVEEYDRMVLIEAEMIKVEYQMKLGCLENQAFELKNKCLRYKRKLEMYQAKRNRMEEIQPEEIENVLDEEYREYGLLLRQRIDEYNRAFNLSQCRTLSTEECKEIKRLYHKIVLKLHPDLHADISETQMALFQNAVRAYECGDLSGLQTVFSIVDTNEMSTELNEDGLWELRKKRDSILGLIEKKRNDIDEMKQKYPYNLVEILQDEDKFIARKTLLLNSIEQSKKMIHSFEERCQMIIDMQKVNKTKREDN